MDDGNVAGDLLATFHSEWQSPAVGEHCELHRICRKHQVVGVTADTRTAHVSQLLAIQVLSKIERADYILITHGHYDHLLDVTARTHSSYSGAPTHLTFRVKPT